MGITVMNATFTKTIGIKNLLEKGGGVCEYFMPPDYEFHADS